MKKIVIILTLIFIWWVSISHSNAYVDDNFCKKVGTKILVNTQCYEKGGKQKYLNRLEDSVEDWDSAFFDTNKSIIIEKAKQIVSENYVNSTCKFRKIVIEKELYFDLPENRDGETLDYRKKNFKNSYWYKEKMKGSANNEKINDIQTN